MQRKSVPLIKSADDDRVRGFLAVAMIGFIGDYLRTQASAIIANGSRDGIE